MTVTQKALFVHFFTATGAVFAMLAMLAATEEKWSLMFLWLVVAFAVDGIDGPLAGWTGWVVIIVITFASAMYFCDGQMKTKDNSFQGFPGCWNMVVIVLFAIEPNFWIILILVLGLALAMFLPLKFVHPVRTERWRYLSLPIALAWTFFAGWAAWVEFHPQSWAHWGLVATSVYLLFAGVVQQAVPQRS